MDWKIINKTVETSTVQTIRLQPSRKIAFKPGQFFLFHDIVEGLEDCRSYSASSSPTREYIEITVKLVREPFFSKHLHELPVGSMIECKGPYGSFVLDESASSIVLIGAGSGIAPLRSMIQYTLDKNLNTTMTLIYSAKTKESVIFRKEMEYLAKKRKINYVLTLTQEKGEYTGRIDEKLIAQAVPNIAASTFYVCGPPAMVKKTIRNLEYLGAKKIHSEQF